MKFPNLVIHREHSIVSLILYRPKQHNALNAELISDLTQALKQLNSDSTISIVVIKADGPTFCAGADLKEMQAKINATYEENLADAENLAELFSLLSQLNAVTVAIVHGPTYGGGIGLLSCCDLVLASHQAIFRLSEVRLGLIPAIISPYLIKAIGYKHTLRYALTAETFTAEDAKTIGLIQQIAHSQEELQEMEYQLLEKLLQNGPEAMKKVKVLLATVSKQQDPHILLKYTAEAIAQCRISEEGQEGLKAFIEGRLAAWVRT